MSSNRRAIEDEASNWLILLSEDPDDASLLARFDAWAMLSPDHRAIWDKTLRAYALYGEVEPRHREAWSAPAAGRGPERDPLALPTVRRASNPRLRRVIPSIGKPRKLVMAGIAAALAVIVAPTVLLHLRADIVTSTGEMRTVRLADGSLVHLSPESAIASHFTDTSREIRLLRGEAYFEVRRDRQRPFSVDANAVRTIVLGTGFDVRLLDDGAAVSVAHGLVGVQSDTVSAGVKRLGAGQWISIASGGTERGRMEPDDVGASTRGEIIADKRTVRGMVDALRPWHSGAIFVIGDRLANRTVTGIYDARDADGVLTAIARTHGAKLRRISPWLLVLSES